MATKKKFSALTLTGSILNPGRQAVPLRLVPLIAPWSVGQTFAIVEGLDEDCRLSLPIRVSDGSRSPRVVTRQFLARVKSENAQHIADNNIRAFPADWFVWSDEIETAFTTYVDCTIGRDNAYAEGLTLVWNPALTDAEDQALRECPDLRALSTHRKGGQLGRPRNPRTLAGYQSLLDTFDAYKAEHPKARNATLLRLIYKDKRLRYASYPALKSCFYRARKALGHKER